MCFGLASAQEMVDNTSFPQAGDTIFYFTDELPQKIDITAGGPNQRWNYTNLKAPYLEYRIVAPAKQGRRAGKYEEAELVWQSSDGSEKYIDVRDDGLWEMGGMGQAPLSHLVSAEFDYMSGLPLQLSDLKFGQDLDYEDRLTEVTATQDLTNGIRKIVGQRFDSLQFITDLARNLSVDAFGTLILPGARYEVVRVRVEDYRSTQVLGSIGRGVWREVEPTLAQKISGSTKQVRYLFIQVEDGKVVAEITTGKEGKPTRVEFSMPTRLARYYDPAKPGQWLYAYPNPAFSTVRFKFMDLEPGRYVIRFYNILGKPLMELPQDLSDTGTIEIGVGHLAKGTYLYSLIDAQGKKLITKRLIILKP